MQPAGLRRAADAATRLHQDCVAEPFDEGLNSTVREIVLGTVIESAWYLRNA